MTDQPLTSPERAFLVEHGGVRSEALAPEAQAAARITIAEATARADRQAAERSLTAAEVAERYGSLDGLYAIHGGDLFPRWQFAEDGPLPGLGLVLPVIPGGLHPLDVEHIMTTSSEALDGRSPRDWLLAGGDPATVADLLADLERE